jgi:hypothetical protein
MKLHQSIQTKQTTKLFNNKYKYKVVLVSKSASWFRGCKFDHVDKKCLAVEVAQTTDPWSIKLNPYEREYTIQLCALLKKLVDYEIRVESPFISFYTNTKLDVESLAKLDSDRVKYVSMPADGTDTILDQGKVIVKNIDFDYKVTMGRTRQDFISFVKWCEGNDKIRMPKRAKADLSKNKCWGGSHFYVKDEKTLTLVKMFVGGFVHSVEPVVKS